MTENKEFYQNSTADLLANDKESVASSSPQDLLIDVKFNKEIKSLSVEEASLLAQKGMKFELIERDFNLLKCLAKRQDKSVSRFLEDLRQETLNERRRILAEKCSEEALVDKIMMLEESKCDCDFSSFAELNEAFPNIKSPEQLPDAVIEASRLKGTLLLDEYLRYRLEQKNQTNKRIKAQENAERVSLGSQRSKKNNANPETEEFIKGLWN